MSEATKSPRQIAEATNDRSNFASAEQGYDPIAGCPTSEAGTRPLRDDNAHPTNPAAPAAPIRNLR